MPFSASFWEKKKLPRRWQLISWIFSNVEPPKTTKLRLTLKLHKSWCIPPFPSKIYLASKKIPNKTNHSSTAGKTKLEPRNICGCTKNGEKSRCRWKNNHRGTRKLFKWKTCLRRFFVQLQNMGSQKKGRKKKRKNAFGTELGLN